jgi:hypothetical protein
MPFLSMRTDPPLPGVCSSCGESGRVWRFGEETLTTQDGYNLLIAHALCWQCLTVILELLDEDDN